MPIRSLAPLAVVVCLAVPALLHAQKGKPQPELPAVAGFGWLDGNGQGTLGEEPIDYHMPEFDSANKCSTTSSGGIRGDGGGKHIGNVTTGEGAYLRAGDNDFLFTLRSGSGRRAYLYFTTSDAPSTSADPRKDFCALALDQFHLHTHVLRPDGTDDLSLGLSRIPLGATYPARIVANFVSADGFTYHIRFNADHYPGSTNVRVTRGGAASNPDPELPNSNWWRIETGADPLVLETGEVAQLVSPALTKKGNPGPNDEGRYVLPFKIVFTTDLTATRP